MTINGLECKIIEKLGKKVTLEIEGQKVVLSSEFMPKQVASGQTIKIYFLDKADATVSEKKLAKSILEQILNGN